MTKYAQWREISHIYYTLRCRCCSRNVFEQRKNALENTRENDNILGGVFKMQATFYILLSKFLFITVFLPDTGKNIRERVWEEICINGNHS